MATPTKGPPETASNTKTHTPAAPPSPKSQALSLLPLFTPNRPLRSTDHARTTTHLGTINSTPALLTLERAALPTSQSALTSLLSTLTDTTTLGANDIYNWYMANTVLPSHPNLKVNLIYPCTDSHISKYSAQRIRWVTETPDVYRTHIAPWIEQTQRGVKRLGWIWNILDGLAEQEDVIFRYAGTREGEGFLMLPDLNWDRKGVEELHLLGIVQRRDLWSLRGLKRRDVSWLRAIQGAMVGAAAVVAKDLARQAKTRRGNGEGGGVEHADEDEDTDIDTDQFKCYVHYQPTYYHFHVHVVHVMLEAGATQAVGKAFSLGLLIEMLEALGDDERGLDGISLGYTIGEESELWKKLFLPLKRGEKVTLNDR